MESTYKVRFHYSCGCLQHVFDSNLKLSLTNAAVHLSYQQVCFKEDIEDMVSSTIPGMVFRLTQLEQSIRARPEAISFEGWRCQAILIGSGIWSKIFPKIGLASLLKGQPGRGVGTG